MRFAIVGPVHPLRGGIAQYTTSLYQALLPCHEVLLVSFSRQYPKILFPGKTQVDTSESALIVPGEDLLDSVSPVSWVRTGRRIASYSPDALVFQWWRPFFAPIFQTVIRTVRKSTPLPVVFICHNILSHEEVTVPGLKVFEKHLIKFAFSNVDGFIVQAEELVQSLGRLKPGANVKKVFHPLYDFYQNWDLGFIPKKESDVPVLLFFGKIRKYKGLETLLKALAEVKKRMKFRAVIAGEFYVSSSKYKRMARSLGLMDQISWLDHYIPNDQVPGLFRNADLVVLPYQNATQSGVVPVAYQFEVPVIATRVGGLSEVIQDNATGFLVPPGNAIALAEKILEYFETSRKLEFQNNIRSFRERLSWSQAADNLVELVTELKGSDSL